MDRFNRRALIVGCNGGVGRAVLALLQHAAAGRRLHGQLETILLVDSEPVADPRPLDRSQLLSPLTIQSADDLARLVRGHRITEVIDLSSIDTLDCTRICDELGAHFLCTSVEEWPRRGALPTDEAIARLLPPRRPALSRRAHLVGSGANPGIVNALAFAAIEAFAQKVGVAPTTEALELDAILITEDDTTAARDAPGGDDVFAMTWSPTHCLEELFEPRAFAARNGRVFGLGHAPTERRYRARCGDRIIAGMATPHEETVTLTRLLPGVDIAFLYRLPLAARRALAAHPKRRAIGAWRLHRLEPPHSIQLTGQDRLGVLLCSRRFGEFWLGYDTDVSSGLAMGTNATQLQVAAGVLAGWAQLGSRVGIQFVEDLDWRKFLKVVDEVLGSPTMAHDPTAPPLTLADRATLGASEA